eukprot:2757934-Prymnesium_polylepis.1
MHLLVAEEAARRTRPKRARPDHASEHVRPRTHPARHVSRRRAPVTRAGALARAGEAAVHLSGHAGGGRTTPPRSRSDAGARGKQRAHLCGLKFGDDAHRCGRVRIAERVAALVMLVEVDLRRERRLRERCESAVGVEREPIAAAI